MGWCRNNSCCFTMYHVNILLLNEGGECYFANGFDPMNERSLLLAYKLAKGGNEACNHYDSVSRIDVPVILTIARHITKKMKDDNGSKIQSINDTGSYIED